MGLFSDKHEESYNQFQAAEHHGHITHDLLGGAVAFEAAKAWENHLAKEGKPSNHAMAKELLAGFAGAAITRLVETKGLNAWEAHKRAQAEKTAVAHIDETIISKEYEGQY